MTKATLTQFEKAVAELHTKKGINIHGRLYHTVAERVEALRQHMGLDVSIMTEILPHGDPDIVRMKATVAAGTTIIATGFAEENRNATTINKTSALENCETSAVGRALAFMGLSGGEIASSNEVEQAIHQQKETWNGPLNKTALKKGASKLQTALGQVNTTEDLEMITTEFQPMLDQLQKDMPDWYFGNENSEGAKKAIDAKREQIEALAA